MVAYLGRRAFGDALAEVERDHPVGQAHQQLHMVLHQQHRQLQPLAQRPNQRSDGAHFLMVQAARRLIEQQQLRIGGERARELDALLRAERKRGDIRFAGTSLLRLARHEVVSLGIARTFQNVALFRTMSVLDNVMVGRHARSRGGFFANAVRLPYALRADGEARDKARELLALLELERVAETPVAALPFGTQKRVELARALASEPELLLLDEPASGLNHAEVGAIGALIRNLRERLQLTVLLVEHHMQLLMSLSDWVVALNFGRLIAEGVPAQVRSHPELVRAYLGTPG